MTVEEPGLTPSADRAATSVRSASTAQTAVLTRAAFPGGPFYHRNGGFDSVQEQFDALSEVARLWSAVGDEATAANEALVGAREAVARAGSRSSALAAVAEALSRLAWFMAEAGKHVIARALLTSSQEAAAGALAGCVEIDDTSTRESRLSGVVADALISAGMGFAAREAVIAAIRDPDARADALMHVARGSLWRGDDAAAREAAIAAGEGLIEKPLEESGYLKRADILSEAGTVLADCGDLGTARTYAHAALVVAESIPLWQTVSDGRGGTVRTRHERAVEWRDLALQSIAPAMASAGERAVRSSVAAIEDPERRAWALVNVSRRFGDRGDEVNARWAAFAALAATSAIAIETPHARGGALVAVASCLAAYADPATAIDACDMDTGWPCFKGEALLRVACVLAAAGNAPAAHQAAAAAREDAEQHHLPLHDLSQLDQVESLLLAGAANRPADRKAHYASVVQLLNEPGFRNETRTRETEALARVNQVLAARKSRVDSQGSEPDTSAAIAASQPISKAADDSGDNAKHRTAKSGCYVATAVYGSYDCPEVSVLRRWRDNSLASTSWGRRLIRFYYRVSPAVVRAVGNEQWFSRGVRWPLDRFVARLRASGYSSLPYSDEESPS